MRKRTLLRNLMAITVLAAATVPLNGCPSDAQAEGVPRNLAVTVHRDAARLGAAWVVGAWHTTPVTDGKGAITNVLTFLTQSGDTTRHTLAATATKDSFSITTTVGTSVSGTFCVQAKRRVLTSVLTSASCRGWSYTENDSPPPGPVMDSTAVREALLDSKLVDTALVALTTGELCPAELRDYRRMMLVAPRAGVVQSEHCATVFAEDVMRDNLRTLAALAVGYPWTPAQDSIWRADTTTQPTLPLTRISTRWFPGPMTVDTFVFGPDGENNMPIATYRATHPGFTWPAPSGT